MPSLSPFRLGERPSFGERSQRTFECGGERGFRRAWPAGHLGSRAFIERDFQRSVRDCPTDRPGDLRGSADGTGCRHWRHGGVPIEVGGNRPPGPEGAWCSRRPGCGRERSTVARRSSLVKRAEGAARPPCRAPGAGSALEPDASDSDAGGPAVEQAGDQHRGKFRVCGRRWWCRCGSSATYHQTHERCYLANSFKTEVLVEEPAHPVPETLRPTGAAQDQEHGRERMILLGAERDDGVPRWLLALDRDGRLEFVSSAQPTCSRSERPGGNGWP